MTWKTRRMFVLFSAFVTAGALLWEILPSFAVPGKFLGDRFIPNPKNPAISFEKARATVASLVEQEIKQSQEDFKVQYSKEDIDRVQAHVWNEAYLELVRHYRPSELPEMKLQKN